MASKVSICSNAMVLVGANAINGFTGASTEEVVAAQLYDSIVENLLASYRWRFASQYAQLSRDLAVPLARWDASYQLPAGATVIFGLFVQGEPIDFDRTANQLLCNAGVDDVVVALVGFIPEEAAFPAYFTTVLQLKLAAAFAVPIADDTQKASLYEGQALRQFAQARAIESQGRTPSKLPVGKLRAYHGGGA